MEAVHHDTLRRGGVIDHVWIRVGDLERSRAFYEMVGRHGGFREAGVHPDRVRFGIPRLGHCRITRLPQRSDMIDINSQL